MIKTIRTNSENHDFLSLILLLDADLRIRDGEDHAFFAQFNKVDKIKYVVVAYAENIAVGCGAIKEYESDVMEVKRMYVSTQQRGKGIASIILFELEKWAKELNYKKCVLETGIKQPEALNLYKKNNYVVIPNYGQYKDVKTSVCFEKYL